MKWDTFDPKRILKALKSNFWTSIFFNQRGGAEEDAAAAHTTFEATAIPESFKDTPVGKYKTFGEIVKGYGEAQKLIGAKGVIMPGENADQTEIDKFQITMGRPEKSDGYKYEPLKDLHADLKITPEVEANFSKFAHKHGLSQKQAAGIRGEYFGMLSQGLTKKDEVDQKAKHETEAALRTEWGAEYNTKLKRTQSLIDKFGGEGAIEAFGDLGNNPAVLKILASIADKFSEDSFTLGSTHTESTISEAQRKINEILANKEHMYHKTGPGHKEAMAEMTRLNEIVHPNTRTEGSLI